MRTMLLSIALLGLVGCDTGSAPPASTTDAAQRQPPGAATVPAPPSVAATATTGATDQAVTALLSAAYDEAVDLKDGWTVPESSSDDEDTGVQPSSREVCADSGTTHTDQRLIAVCSTFEDAGHAAPGLVDLWQILPADAANASARIGARETDIESNGWGTPGEVHVLRIGPDRSALMVTSGFSNMGEMVETRMLYHADNGRFAKIVSFTSAHDNGASCDPDEDVQCRERQYSVACTLNIGDKANTAGFFDMTLETVIERHTGTSEQTILIPNVDGRYHVSTERIQQRCDES